MLNFFLTEDVFGESLKEYIKLSKYKSTNLDDLWDIFTEQARKANVLDDSTSVNQIMNPWKNKCGFPIIRVEVDSSKNAKRTVTISQTPFRFLGEEKNEAEESCWDFPLGYFSIIDLSLNERNIPGIFNCAKSRTFEIPLHYNEWIIINPKAHVPSYTYFDDKYWNSIIDNLFVFDESSRLRLILDMFALAEIKEVTYERVFDTMNALSGIEYCGTCWAIALIELNKIHANLLGDTTGLLEHFENYVRSLIKSTPIHEIHFDYYNESERFEDEVKTLLLVFSWIFDHSQIENEFMPLFETFLKFLEERPPVTNSEKKKANLLLKFGLCQRIKKSPEYWEETWQTYLKTETLEKKDLILEALGCSEDENILKQYLQQMLHMTDFSAYDYLNSFRSLSSNKLGYSIMKEHFINNYSQGLPHILQENNIKLEQLFAELFSNTTSRGDMDELIKWKEDHKEELNSSDEFLLKSMKRANKNVSWLEIHREALAEYLNSY